MTEINVLHIDAFSDIPNKGNPAGVVVDADHLTEHQMQRIAKNVGFNETVFVLKSDEADIRLKYFTPGHEMDLCGHATIASIYALRANRNIKKDAITIETNVGILPVRVYEDNNQISIYMKQTTAHFLPFKSQVNKLAEAIGLTKHDIDLQFPIVYGSTGIWTLIVPIKRLTSFEKMKPNNQLFPKVLTEMPKVSIHLFCLETYDELADMHGRHFSSPFSGTTEDAVTGTASGVMGAYFAKYINQDLESSKISILVEQGQEIDRDGRVSVEVEKKSDSFEVGIFGTAVYVKEFKVKL
ncbi:PhzF family phenazine biosynthesis protein [Chengkuizengella axinellae]|uniref:PhzF family phenazine biosynthesis protein n=1 Tax=Chengkuizengella axinellae TaxID=3064388 RepID=A0ABT9IXL9_9BACL|nr:PhzF family phenazine biosynthesis protein [Chengkuizengella sp. 2205SS18-9]MDP5274114.1 PhzF family phenazine biosynthesis protein [Chengkuizengella sp. 2205SS18-9]